MPRRSPSTHKGLWTQEAALWAACDLFSADGFLTRKAICRVIGRSRAWGSTYLDTPEALLEGVLRLEPSRLEARLVRGVPLPDALEAFANVARELDRRGQLHTHRELRRILQAAVPAPSWAVAALLGLAAGLPRREVASAVRELLARLRT